MGQAAKKAKHTPRAKAVAMFRELADRLESGELIGARVQWSERYEYVETVEVPSEPPFNDKGELVLVKFWRHYPLHSVQLTEAEVAAAEKEVG